MKTPSSFPFNLAEESLLSIILLISAENYCRPRSPYSTFLQAGFCSSNLPGPRCFGAPHMHSLSLMLFSFLEIFLLSVEEPPCLHSTLQWLAYAITGYGDDPDAVDTSPPFNFVQLR